MTDEQLSALLRMNGMKPRLPLFRPAAGDVHRPAADRVAPAFALGIALERFQTFLCEHSMGPFSYAGVVASGVAVVALTVGVVNWVRVSCRRLDQLPRPRRRRNAICGFNFESPLHCLVRWRVSRKSRPHWRRAVEGAAALRDRCAAR